MARKKEPRRSLVTDFQMAKVGFLLDPNKKGRYYHLKRLIDMVWHDSNIVWNPWLENQLQSLTDDRFVHRVGNTTVRFVSWTGPGACVHGDTRIEDPIRKTKRTIADLCHSGIAPHVMTLRGPVLATVPFIKGVEELYEVVLEDGNRFRCTAAHRVMSEIGKFVTVSDLQCGSEILGYNPKRPCSSLNQYRIDHNSLAQPVKVTSVGMVGQHVFYDLCVPDVHHYFAEGAIHHNSGKTFSSGLYAMAWFMCSPENSCVTLTSTSKSAMGGRVWGVIKDLYSDGYDPDTGYPFDWHIVNSRKILQWPAGDEKHNIACFAVEEGELLKSVDKIKGRHTERMLLIVDEANGTPEAIFNVIPNMLKGCKELVVLVFDNAGDMYGNHGRCCEPKAGWESVTVDSEEWETKGVQEWGLPPGVCKHYDGQKSPNVLAGKTIYPHIYSWENWQTALKHPTDSIHFWSQDRGYWAPSGTSTTVFSAPLISRCDGMGFNPIHSNREVYAFLDPGFGGDKCVAQFAEVGTMENGLFVIQIGNPIYIEPRINSEAERDYQIANMFSEECRSRGVKPHNAGTDATAIGRGVFAILSANWSPEVKRVEWGGKASDKPSSRIDGRPAHEIYGDRVTELWFSVRDFMEAGQLKGLYPEAVKQACSRQYTISGRRYFLNTKRECKVALGHSPDEMDAIAGLVEVVRLNGFIAQPKVSSVLYTRWHEVTREVEKSLALADSSIGADTGGWASKDVGIAWSDYGD